MTRRALVRPLTTESIRPLPRVHAPTLAFRHLTAGELSLHLAKLPPGVHRLGPAIFARSRDLSCPSLPFFLHPQLLPLYWIPAISVEMCPKALILKKPSPDAV